jgi:hypothetical protein
MTSTGEEGDSSPEAPRVRPNRQWVNPLSGKTIRFTFSEGPTKGAAYDHTFHDDGTVTWRDSAAPKRDEPSEKASDKDGKGEKEPPTEYGSFQVADDVYVVSYLSKAGYTLTVALNFETDELFGFASNNQNWYRVRGIFEVLGY